LTWQKPQALNSFEHKIWDVSLDTATLHIGETERGAWEDKKYDMVLVQMVLFPEFVTACNAKACLIIPKNSYPLVIKN
jgi:hypothetical protein